MSAPLLTDNLISYWPLNEESGDAIDAHGSNDLAVSSGDTIPASDGGRLFALADQDYMSIASNASLVMYNTSFTIRCKVKLTSKPASQMYLVNKFRTTATATREYTLFWNNSTDRFTVTLGTSVGASGTALIANNFGAPSTDVWYNLTIWYDHWDSVLAIQVDDGIPNRASQTTSPMDAASPFFIGALSNPSPSLFADATIKDVGVWKRVLSPAEIKWLNNGGTSRTYSEIVAAEHIANPWQMVAVNGIWTWFNSPEAVAHQDKLWVGSFPNAGEKPSISEVDILTRSVTQTTIDQAVGETDDHDNPAIIRLKSGYLLAVFSHHNGDCWAARSTNKNDATAWETPVKIEDTLQIAYAQIMQMASGRIYDFCRHYTGSNSNYPQRFYTSDDDGATWSGPTTLLETGNSRPYFRWWKTSETRADFFCTTGQPDEATNSLYHGYILFDPNTNAMTFYKSDGTLIGDETDLPLTLSDLTLVYDGSTSECWIWDAKVIGSTPVAVFSVFPSQGTTAHEYHQARWTGSAWATEKICDAGTTGTADYLYAVQEHYSGGVAQDPNDIDKVYVSREFGSGDFRIHAVEQIDDVWTVTDWLSEYLTYQVNGRPRTASARGQTQVLWWGGTYASFTNYNTNIYMHPDKLTAVTRPARYAGALQPLEAGI